METAIANRPPGAKERDPELARLEIGRELLNDNNIDGKTELSDKEIFAFAAVDTFIERIYTPRYIDYPYMDKLEAFNKRHDLLIKLSNPEIAKNPEAYRSYQETIKPELKQLEDILSPLAQIVDRGEEKIIRVYTPPLVYKKFEERIKKMRVSKERKSRWEILNLVIIERTLNGIRDILGRMAGEETDKNAGLMDRLRSYF